MRSKRRVAVVLVARDDEHESGSAARDEGRHVVLIRRDTQHSRKYYCRFCSPFLNETYIHHTVALPYTQKETKIKTTRQKHQRGCCGDATHIHQSCFRNLMLLVDGCELELDKRVHRRLPRPASTSLTSRRESLGWLRLRAIRASGRAPTRY